MTTAPTLDWIRGHWRRGLSRPERPDFADLSKVVEFTGDSQLVALALHMLDYRRFRIDGSEGLGPDARGIGTEKPLRFHDQSSERERGLTPKMQNAIFRVRPLCYGNGPE